MFERKEKRLDEIWKKLTCEKQMKKNLREREANETFMINKFTIKKKNLARHERQ